MPDQPSSRSDPSTRDQSPQKEAGKPFPVDTDHLAEVRTSLARSRTYLAAERTFAAWIRTGFAIAGVGVTLGTTQRETDARTISLVIASALVFVGIASFVYGWRGYRSVYNYITTHYEKRNLETQSFRLNFFALTLMTIVLIVATVLGVYLMFS